MAERGWSRPFNDQIKVPDGTLVTLRDAGDYIASLPKAVQEWQAAAEASLLVVERGGPTMFAGIGMMRALNAGKPAQQEAPRRKRAKAYRVIR